MRKKSINIRVSLLFLLVFSAWGLFGSFAFALEESADKIEVHDKSVQEVLKTVSKHSGYEILMVGDPGTRKINGIFYLSDLEKSLRRIFKGTNTFIEFYEKNKQIIVKLPGESNVVKFSGEKKFMYDAGQVDPDTGLTYEELMVMREREKEEQLARMSDPESIDPESGLSYQEQMLTRELEKKEQMERVLRPGEIDPTTGISYQEQKSLREREKDEQTSRMENPESIDPSTGISYTEQMSVREREKDEMMTRTSNPDEIDPDTGLTYGELMLIREREKK